METSFGQLAGAWAAIAAATAHADVDALRLTREIDDALEITRLRAVQVFATYEAAH